MAQEAGALVSVLGTAEVWRGGRWQPIGAGELVAAGEVLRTGAGSRAAVQLANGSQLKLNAHSRLELKQVAPPQAFVRRVSAQLLQSILRVLSGEIWFRNNGEPLEIQTRPATATVRGTEFTLAVGPEDSARLAVLEGLVEFKNPQGEVVVGAGEQAAARVGEAPRKTVLVNPLDAVQWSLYYPGMVSYRDYPLTAVEPARRPEQWAAAARRVGAAPRDVNTLIDLGELSFDLGRRAEARQAFTQAVRLGPPNARAHTGLGWVYLEAGEVEAALGEFRQARPPTLNTLAGMANALYRLNRLEEADRVITQAQQRFPSSPLPWTQAALNRLIQGRVAEAERDLKQTLARNPRHALAYGLRSNIALVQNHKAQALQAAQQAVAANPASPSAYLDLSLVKQAEFQLEDALQAARQAVALDPDNPQALIQESRLLFGLGRIAEARQVAEKARQRAPHDAVVNTTWGFLQLADDRVNEAIQAFEAAIAQDSTRGEPHLGLGLALFRQNKTNKAVEEMQKATLLEPKVSLYHSYLGKAYYEIKQEQLAQMQFTRAKQLDPRDPTPFFYDAILEQSINRPIEGLQNLQHSIELNDNRAVYRSRLLLDEDLAARGAALGQIYNQLEFQQLALVEGWKSLNTDPDDYSAHRLLADSYSALPRHELARASELLQSQLLQPFNVKPVQPQLAGANLSSTGAGTKLLVLEGAGPTALSLNEFNPLFVRDRLMLLASGLIGGNDIRSDEIVLFGIKGGLSYSLGQFHYKSEGFRENNDIEQDTYNAFAQLSLSPNTSVQTEFLHTKQDQGDLLLSFDPNKFSSSMRQNDRINSVRFGLRHDITPGFTLLANVNHENSRFDATLDGVELVLDQDGYVAELQALFRSTHFNIISGLGYLNLDRKFVTDSILKSEFEHANGYAYMYAKYPSTVIWTLGGSVDISEGESNEEFIDDHQFSPKLGVTWNPLPATTIRAAAFKFFRRPLLSAQTIEPTQVAGFNQFFDDSEGTNSWRYGIGVDQRFGTSMYAGAEYSRRDLEVQELSLEERISIDTNNADETLGRLYFYWTPQPWLSLSSEYIYERLQQQIDTTSTNIETHRFPLTIALFSSSGFSVELKTTYANQKGNFFFKKIFGEVPASDEDQFWIIDASLKYRLPKRRGLISLEVRNLFDEKFRFQETDRTSFLFSPERLILTRFTLAF